MNTRVPEYVKNPDAISGLARSYHALLYSQQLRSILSSIYPSENFDSYSKFELHQRINRVLVKHYSGEEILKYALIKDFFNRNVTAAFELRVNNSRIDFLTVNGTTQSFEIKSGLDNLQKLSKQVSDYVKVFEYNSIIIDEKHLKAATEILPDGYGIIVYKGLKKKIIRKAILNADLDPRLQLTLFTKKELNTYFPEYITDRKLIFDSVEPHSINEVFKRMLKKRYASRWKFIKSNYQQILPIDFHFFYHNNISPNVVYGAI